MPESQSTLPRVSVVIPIYRGEQFVATAVRSALDQTHRNVEVIAVDDESPDDSLRVLQEFGDRIRIVSQKNTGVAGARNRGIAAGTGEFIAFLDQDDWWKPTKLERQLAVFGTDSRIGLVHTGVAHIESESGREMAPLNPLARPAEMVGDCSRRLLLGNPIYNSSVMVRRSAIDRVGACDTTLAGNTVADYDLWLRVSKHYLFGFVNEPVTCYRIHAHQGMHDRRAMLTAELQVLLRIHDEATWRRDPDTRERLASLYDELAVAFFDCGDHTSARRYFADAMRVAPTPRSALRWAASQLPPSLVDRFRR